MIKILKKIGKFFLYVIGFITVYVVAAFTLPLITVNKEKDTAEDIEIFIITNGVHTDIVVPVVSEYKDWSKVIDYGGVSDESYPYLAMGWGDKGFYLETPEWSDLKASVAFKAAFGLSTTAIHTTFYKSMTIDETCKSMMLSKAQYLRLVKYIDDSFESDSSGKFIIIETDAHYGETDSFYEAKGAYSIFKTCNSWANSALKACGQKCCLWTPFDKGIFAKYK
jgi:uncharacterized protein (TIGR02117 family)